MALSRCGTEPQTLMNKEIQFMTLFVDKNETNVNLLVSNCGATYGCFSS